MKLEECKSLDDLLAFATKAVIEQGVPSWSAAQHRCAYRGQQGTKCAVGHFLPDEHYREGSEGLTAYSMLHTLLDVYPFLNAGDVEPIRYLQICHDTVAVAIHHDKRKQLHEFVAAFKEEVRGNIDAGVLPRSLLPIVEV